MAARNIRVRGIRRPQIDEDKLALAFLLLAKIIHEQDQVENAARSADAPHATAAPGGPEAA
jgi:hypothetical protein